MKVIPTWRKLVAALPGSVLVYLLQACVMQYLPLYGVNGDLTYAYLAVLLVSCGKKTVFCASCMIGMLMETTLSSVNGLYVICYPLITMLWAQAFADRNDRQRERREMQHPNRRQEDLPPFLRIGLSAAAMSATMQVVLLGYVYLAGSPLDMGHASRALAQVLYCTALSLGIALPIRMLFGMYRRVKTAEEEGGNL